MVADILIVDDEADIRELISGILEDEGYETRLAHNSDAALAELSQRRPTLVVLDIWLQGSKLDGLDLLLEIKQLAPELPVVIISGHGNIETAVAAAPAAPGGSRPPGVSRASRRDVARVRSAARRRARPVRRSPRQPARAARRRPSARRGAVA